MSKIVSIQPIATQTVLIQSYSRFSKIEYK